MPSLALAEEFGVQAARYGNIDNPSTSVIGLKFMFSNTIGQKLCWAEWAESSIQVAAASSEARLSQVKSKAEVSSPTCLAGVFGPKIAAKREAQLSLGEGSCTLP